MQRGVPRVAASDARSPAACLQNARGGVRGRARQFRNFPKYIVMSLSLVTVSFFPQQVQAQQDISFDAKVSANQVELGSFVQLNLRLAGAQNVVPPQLPPIDGFQTRYVGPSTNITIVNGQQSSSISFVYYLYPEKLGQFQIPPISIDIGGKTFSTDPIPLEVIQGREENSSENNHPSTSLQDKIFLTLNIPKQEVYANEKIPLTIKLYVTGLKAKYEPLPQLTSEGFIIDQFSEPQPLEEVIGGIRYRVIEFNTFIYPVASGELTIGPAKLQTEVYYKSQRQHAPFGDMDSFFDDSFFNNFFDNYDTRPVTVQSADLRVKVLPLPEEGKPADFSVSVV